MLGTAEESLLHEENEDEWKSAGKYRKRSNKDISEITEVKADHLELDESKSESESVESEEHQVEESGTGDEMRDKGELSDSKSMNSSTSFA